MKELRDYIYSFEGFIKTCISLKGWGITWNINFKWEDLIKRNIAEKLL